MKTKKFSNVGRIMMIAATTALVSSLQATPAASPEGPEEIASLIQVVVKSDQVMQGATVTITVKNGIAVLEGQALTLNQSERAVARALATMDVRAVLNLIEINAAAPPLKDSVKNALKTQKLVDARRVKILENQGRITLVGDVGTWDEQELAREVVSQVPAVRGIDNQLQVTNEGIRTDAQIKAQLQQVIADDPLYVGLDLGVQVKDGIVVLQGAVGNKTEIDRLVRRSYVTGVFEVKIEKLTINHELAMEALTDKELTTEQTLATYQEVLAMDPRIDISNIRASLREGVMVLSGNARDIREKDAAEANARGIPGVISVSNELRIRAGREVATNESR